MKTNIAFLTILLVTCVAEKGFLFLPHNEGISSDCGILGTWKNELNSTMIFSSCKNGQLEGKYNTAVGKASDFYVLTGRYTLSGPEKDVVELGWVVAWNNTKYGNSNSVTSWNGIYYPKEGIIHTQWILTSYAERKDLWETSLINHDEFKRVCLTC